MAAEDGTYNDKPYDYWLANAAGAVDHCMKLGAVILPQKKTTGFRVGPDRAPQPDERGSGLQRDT